MKEDSIIYSIKTQRLHLNGFEKFVYFKVPILCFFVVIMSITNGFQEVDIDFNDTLPKLCIVFLIIGIVTYKLKYDRLKMKVVENPNSEFRDRILKLATDRNWKIELNNDHAIILKTIPIRGYHEYDYHNKNEGERMYIFVERNKIYLKSINNVDNIFFRIDKGENIAHESVLVQTIKASR